MARVNDAYGNSRTLACEVPGGSAAADVISVSFPLSNGFAVKFPTKTRARVSNEESLRITRRTSFKT